MCNTFNALNVLVLRQQTSLKQTSEIVSAQRQIAQIVTGEFQAAGPATANAQRPYVLSR